MLTHRSTGNPPELWGFLRDSRSGRRLPHVRDRRDVRDEPNGRGWSILDRAQGTRSSDLSHSPKGVGKPSFTARIERPPLYRGGSASKKGIWHSLPIIPSLLVISEGWGLIDLPLRASNEGSLRPRVARAQEIIRLHPLSSVLHPAGQPGYLGYTYGVYG